MIALISLCVLSVVGAIGMLVAKQPIRSALWLLTTMISLAAIYALLNAPVIAALQVILYAGAIMTLIIYIIMLLDTTESDFFQRFSDLRVWGLLIVALVSWIGLVKVGGQVVLQGELASSFQPLNDPAGFGGIRQLATALMTKDMVAFQLTALVALAATIAVVALVNRPLKKDSES